MSIGVESLTGGRRALITFARDLLLGESRTAPPRSTVVVDIVASHHPARSAAAGRVLRFSGHTLKLRRWLADGKS